MVPGMANPQTIICKSPAETFNLGASLGRILTSGDVVTLNGELGAGKTCLTKGIAVGLGITDADSVTSPSFTIINEYQGRLPLFHMDFYRLENPAAWPDLGLEEYLYGPGVTVIEWPERIAGILPPEHLEICLLFVAENEREMVFVPHGQSWVQRVGRFFSNLAPRSDKKVS